MRGMVGSWYDEKLISSFARDGSTIVGGAQQQVGSVTAEFLDAVLAEMDAPPTRERFRSVKNVRGVEPQVEWRRPAEQFRYAVSQGASEADAQQAAVMRATTLVTDDITFAMRRAVTERLSVSTAVIGYRRVIHPEESAGGTCGLCAVASDRRYHAEDLLPVHARCACTVLPITRAHDPGSALNDADFKRLYGEAGSTGADDLKKIKYKIVEHSELGPQLVAASAGAGEPIAA
jgi:hypothetical protein